MHTVKDFCNLMNVSRRSMVNYLAEIAPFLKLSGNIKRKRMYTPEEAEIVLEHLKKIRLKKFKRTQETLSAIFMRVATKD